MLIPFNDLFKRHNIQPTGVIHIGASEGQECKAYYDNGIERSVWIEAIPDVYEKLRKNIFSYPNATALQACISDVDGEEVTFNISNNDGQSSSYLEFGTHTVIHPTVKFIDKIKLRTKRVDTLFLENHLYIQHYDFLNIDLQGCELPALKSMGDGLRHIKYAYLEVNKQETYVGCALVGDIDAYLGQYGMVRVETSPFVGNSWGDAFYINKNYINRSHE